MVLPLVIVSLLKMILFASGKTSPAFEWPSYSPPLGGPRTRPPLRCPRTRLLLGGPGSSVETLNCYPCRESVLPIYQGRTT